MVELLTTDESFGVDGIVEPLIMYHFHDKLDTSNIKLETFQVNFYPFRSKLDAFEIKMNNF